jgi:4-hydroxy-tetrahydrodipicolinate synthase
VKEFDMAAGSELSGVLPVIQTPFDDEGLIDEAVLIKECRWVLDQGVSGLTTGMVSEVLRLSELERHQLTEIVVGVAIERGALSVISCGDARARRRSGRGDGHTANFGGAG